MAQGASFTGLGLLPGTSDSIPLRDLGDGMVVMGYGFVPGSGYQGFRWTQAEGLTDSTAGAYSVLASTNLADWEYLGPAIPLYLFTDTNAPALPQRYYRLQWP